MNSKKEVKIVFVDGNLNTGMVRSIRGRITDETDNTLTVMRSNGSVIIGKQFLVKVEDWY